MCFLSFCGHFHIFQHVNINRLNLFYEDRGKMAETQNAICPTCSENLVLSTNLLEEKHKHLLVFLIRMLDCEVETSNQSFNICNNCDKTLKSFVEFKLLCEKSIERFRRVKSEEEPTEKQILFFVKESFLQYNDYSEPVPSQNSVSSEDQDRPSSPEEDKSILQTYLEKEASSQAKEPQANASPKQGNLKPTQPIKTATSLNSRTRRSTRKKGTSKEVQVKTFSSRSRSAIALSPNFYDNLGEDNHRRLVRYTADVVARAYKDSMKPFFGTRQCPICLICMNNRHRLATHMTKIHSNARHNWCIRCNTMEDNITEHNDTIHHKEKRLYQCLLCKRYIPSGTELRGHIERHSVTKLRRKLNADWLICHHCPEIFESAKELNIHVCPSAPMEEIDIDYSEIPKGKPSEDRIIEIRPRARKHYEKFPHEIVDRALRETMTDFYTNRKCPICGLVTSNLNMLKCHVLGDVHKDLRTKWCCKCNKLVDNLDKHKDEHPEEFYYCPFCEKDYDDRYKFKMHLTNHSDAPFETIKTAWFICNKCPKAFPYEDELQQHLKLQCEKDIFNNRDSKTKAVRIKEKFPEVKPKPPAPVVKSCPLCRTQVKYLSMHIKKVHMKTFKSKRKLVRVRRESALETADSQETGKSLENAAKSKASKQEHNGIEQGASRKKKLKTQKVRLKVESYLCNYCGYKANTKTRLTHHLITHTGEKPYECSICEKLFSTSESRNGHELRHVGDKRFPCDICGKMYMSKGEVRMHRVMHETKPQECQFCHKTFCRPQLLKMHMRKHTDADKFPCTQCEAKFHLNRLLTRHVIDMHTTDRPYKCSYCAKDFKHIEHLNNHERIHKGIKPYACSCCSFVTSTAYSLTLHMSRHPEDAPKAGKPHKCDLCFKSYTTNAMLMSHTKNVHQKGPIKSDHAGKRDGSLRDAESQHENFSVAFKEEAIDIVEKEEEAMIEEDVKWIY